MEQSSICPFNKPQQNKILNEQQQQQTKTGNSKVSVQYKQTGITEQRTA